MADELDPKKYIVLNTTQKRLITIIALFFTVVVLPIFGYYYYTFAINRPAQLDIEKELVIEEGMGVSAISNYLYDEGFVNSALLFKAYVFVSGLDSNIQAGAYTIPAGTPIVDLVAILQNGTNDRVITFLEGWRNEEIARQAADDLNTIDYEDFVRKAAKHAGYLFPDTYYLSIETTNADLIEKMTETFDKKTAEILTEEKLNSLSMTRDEVVTFASIVEREVHSPEDRPIVAGVLIKRWRSGQILGADATTQYAVAPVKFGCVDELQADEICPSKENYENIDWWPNPATFTQELIEFNSPYNTRVNPGLPPTPISNPGLAAIEAVVNYAPTEYEYYLTDNNGVTHYAVTLDQHIDNINSYLR